MFSLLTRASRPPSSFPPVTIGNWTAGAGTTINQVADHEQIILASGTNPRATRRLTGLSLGVSYRIRGNVYMGTISGAPPQLFRRVATDQILSTGNSVINASHNVDAAFDDTFVCTNTTMYYGLVAVTSVIGELCENSFDIIVDRLP